MRRKPGSSSPIALLVVWSLLTLGADALIFHGVVRDLWAMGYPQVTGTITDSAVKVSRGKSTTYRLDVRYTYAVNGQRFTGNRHRYSSRGVSDQDEVEAQARRYAVGAEVPVFHAPDAPADSVLEPGITGGDLFLMLFLLPFNVVMVGLMVMAFTRREETAEVRPEQREGRLHVSLNDTSPALAGAYGAAGTAFATIFLVGIPTGFNPSVPVALLAWAAIVAAGVYAVRWKRGRMASGHYDLVLDPSARRLSLPAIGDRPARLDVRWDEVQSITVETHTRKTSKGGTQLSYRPTLLLSVGEPSRRRQVLVDWSDPDRAEVLVAWLRARVKPRGSDSDVSLSA